MGIMSKPNDENEKALLSFEPEPFLNNPEN